jgi:PKD repeat protein
VSGTPGKKPPKKDSATAEDGTSSDDGTTTDDGTSTGGGGSGGDPTTRPGGTTTRPTTTTPAPKPPVAKASSDCPPGLKCDFDGNASTDSDGTIVTYEWNFGDDKTATGATASHTYSAAGTYTVKLTVTDDKGLKSSTEIEVTVAAPATTSGN